MNDHLQLHPGKPPETTDNNTITSPAQGAIDSKTNRLMKISISFKNVSLDSHVYTSNIYLYN